MLTLDQVRRLLDSRQRQTLEVPGKARAAVLLPIFYKDGALQLLFTRRTELVKHHKGQISFPGGAQDGAEPILATALRETEEEIGLGVAKVEILGVLDDLVTSTSAGAYSFVVTPFVGAIPHPYPFVLHPREVAELVVAPLAALLEQERRGVKTVATPRDEYPSYEYDGHLIWGYTGIMLQQFLRLLASEGLEEKP